MAGEDEDQKTEQPTAKKLEEAHQKGNVPTSREVGSFMMLGVLALTVAWFSTGMGEHARNMLSPFITDADSMQTDANGLGKIMNKLMFGAVVVLAPMFIAAIFAALTAGFIQNGFIFSIEPIVPKLDKISPLAGIKRIFSMRSVVELLKSLMKMGIVMAVVWVTIFPELTHLKQLPNSSIQAFLMYLLHLASRLTIGVAIAMFFVAILDTFYQRWQYMKTLRMTRQEIKDEYKQSEGDPMIKGRLRRLRAERARNRMMSNVPKADVVITNPTHYAVALQYDVQNMRAPVVVAKGMDLVALRIRELAEEHKVPIVENAPLARTLFASTEIEQEIPFTEYEAVAKIISYVYSLKGKRFKR